MRWTLMRALGAIASIAQTADDVVQLLGAIPNMELGLYMSDAHLTNDWQHGCLVISLGIRGSELSNDELVEYAAKGMLQGLDPHSTFFTSQEFQRFYFDLNREYGGIGAFVNFDQDNDFSIVRPGHCRSFRLIL